MVGWAPWISEEYAYGKVMEHLGGPDTLFTYLGEDMLMRNVPKSFRMRPFVSSKYFSGETLFIVTFYGIVF